MPALQVLESRGDRGLRSRLVLDVARDRVNAAARERLDVAARFVDVDRGGRVERDEGRLGDENMLEGGLDVRTPQRDHLITARAIRDRGGHEGHPGGEGPRGE